MTYLLAVRGLLGRVPWQVWAILGLAVAVMFYGNHREAQGRYEGRAEMQVIIDRKEAARLAAITESLRIAKLNAQLTEEVNRNVAQELVQERAGADAFIARGGVRRCPAARTNPSPTDQGTRVNAGAGALPELDDLPVVTVLPEDVRICTENTVKARAWQQWGLGIEVNNKPER
jgi:hypothetical protein